MRSDLFVFLMSFENNGQDGQHGRLENPDAHSCLPAEHPGEYAVRVSANVFGNEIGQDLDYDIHATPEQLWERKRYAESLILDPNRKAWLSELDKQSKDPKFQHQYLTILDQVLSKWPKHTEIGIRYFELKKRIESGKKKSVPWKVILTAAMMLMLAAVVFTSLPKIRALFRSDPAVPTTVKPASTDRFMVQGKNRDVVLDTRTGLMWAAEDNGSDIDFKAAKAYCDSFTGGGYTDWRLPTSDELESLYDESQPGYFPQCSSSYKVYLTDKIRLSCWWVWASDGSSGAVFYFNNGKRIRHPLSWNYLHRVLPVRVGK